MASFHRLLLVGFTILIIIPAARAQGILEVYDQSLQSDPALQRANEDRLANQESLPQARALQLPRLDAFGSLSRSYISNAPANTDSSFNSSDLRLSMRQPLYNRANKIRVKQAEFIVNQADANYTTAEQDLIIRVAQRYFDVLEARDTLVFVTADKNATARQLEQAQRRFEVGLITITDVQEAQARFDLATADEIVAINDLADAKEALREITSVYYNDLNLLTDRMPLVMPEPADPEAWVNLALQNNPAVISASLGAETSRENVDLQRANRYPTVDLAASVASNNDAQRALASRPAQVGIEVTIPIYEGGAKSSRIREAAYQYESAKETLEIRQRDVIRRVRNSYRGIDAAIRRVNALNQAVTSNRSGLEATQAGFDVGTRTIVDVLDAQRDLFSAQRDYAVSRYRYVIFFLQLKQAAGVVDREELEIINGWLDPPDDKKSQPEALRTDLDPTVSDILN